MIQRKNLNAGHLAHNEDWEGNAVAFTRPRCGKVFIVTAAGKTHRGERSCPGTAWIDW